MDLRRRGGCGGEHGEVSIAGAWVQLMREKEERAAGFPIYHECTSSSPLGIEDNSLAQADLAALANEAHEKICPYSNATRGNIDVQLEVVGA